MIGISNIRKLDITGWRELEIGFGGGWHRARLMPSTFWRIGLSVTGRRFLSFQSLAGCKAHLAVSTLLNRGLGVVDWYREIRMRRN
jgi:hypothetical protein